MVAVDPRGLFAYGVADDFLIAYDLQTFVIQEYTWTDFFSNANNPLAVIPFTILPAAIDVNSNAQQTEGVILAYFEQFYYTPTAILFYIHGLNISFVTSLPLNSPPVPFSAKQYAREYSMSVALNSQHEALIGITKSSATMLISTANATLNLLNSQTVPSSGFGKSVIWLDNSSAIAILALSLNPLHLGVSLECISTNERVGRVIPLGQD